MYLISTHFFPMFHYCGPPPPPSLPSFENIRKPICFLKRNRKRELGKKRLKKKLLLQKVDEKAFTTEVEQVEKNVGVF